jgi:hypothetical protein
VEQGLTHHPSQFTPRRTSADSAGRGPGSRGVKAQIA